MPGNSNELYHKLDLVIISNAKLLEKLEEAIIPPKNIKEDAKELEEIYFLVKG